MALSDEAWARAAMNERLVYSTKPTAMQSQMPESVAQAIQVDRIPLISADSSLKATLATVEQGKGTPATVLLSVHATDILNIDVVLASFDGAGKPIGRVSTRSGAFLSLPGDHVPTLSHPDSPLVWSEIPLEFRWATSHYNPYGNEYTYYAQDYDWSRADLYTDDELRHRADSAELPYLLHPEACEPLDPLAGFTLTAIAQAEKANIVADLPDDLVDGSLFVHHIEPYSVARLLRYSTLTTRFEIEDQDSWLTFRPRDLYAVRRGRVDRVALGSALRKLAYGGLWTLSDRADLVTGEPGWRMGMGFDERLIYFASPSAHRSLHTSAHYDDKALLRIYGALGSRLPTQAVAFSSLPQKAQDALSSLVFNGTDGPCTERKLHEGTEQEGNVQTDDHYGALLNLSTERTEYWPNGIPADAIIEIKTERRPAIYGVAPNALRVRLGGSDPRTQVPYAPSQSPAATNVPRLDRYAKGSVVRVTLKLDDGCGHGFVRVLYGDEVRPDAPTIGITELPSDLKSAIQKAHDQMKSG